jgi:uncharacterized membrane protein
MKAKWSVTKFEKFSDRLVVRLIDAAGRFNPVAMTFDGNRRTYHWDGWRNLKVSTQYHDGIDDAVRKYLSK